jgi:threonine/homoserine/homoserine lactone efflux protein
MPSWPAAIGMFTVSLIMVLTPGPNMIYLVSRSITQGRRAGVISLGCVALGFLVYLTATNLGLAAVFVAVPSLYVTVELAGLLHRLAGIQGPPARRDVALRADPGGD